MRRFLFVLMPVLALVLAVPVAASGADSTPKPPNSMAAIGDSMSQAADVCCWYGDHPANSWSTGDAGWDGITSHYERIRALNSAIAGKQLQRLGVRRADERRARRRPGRPSSQGAGYVTILMGANDVCTSSPSTMTSVETFRAAVPADAGHLDAGLPDGRTSSWPASRTSTSSGRSTTPTPRRQFVWDAAGICQSLLSPNRTEAERQTVRAPQHRLQHSAAAGVREVHALQVRRQRGLQLPVQPQQVSKLDYFHPSLTGQSHVASTTWSASWWG